MAMQAYDAPLASFACAVRAGDYLPASELLTGEGDRKFLAYDSLPGNEGIKAIGIDKESLFVELAPFDLNDFATSRLPPKVRLETGRRAGIFLGARKLISMHRGSPKIEREHGARVLWMISRAMAPEHVRLAIEVLDTLDQYGAYLKPEGGGESMSASAASIGVALRLDLQMSLIQAQLPVLALRQGTQLGMRGEMTMELQQLQRFERWLERNPLEAIEAALARDPSPAGQLRLARMIEFKLARDMKKGLEARGRDVSWSEARRLIRSRLLQSSAS
jgi:hypothetical protein